MKAVGLMLVSAALVGCAADEKLEPKGPPAQVSVFREPSLSDGLFPMLFAVDGRPLGQLYPGDALRFEIAAGDHKFETVLGVYNCSADVALASGKSYAYRLARGCVVERVGGGGDAVTARRGEPGLERGRSWAEEMEARDALESEAAAQRLPARYDW